MSLENTTSIDPIVRQIIARDCHVSMSNRAVIRHVISRLKDGWATYRSLPRESRKALLRQCIRCHAENWKLYVDVMSGRSRRVRRSVPHGSVAEHRNGSRLKRKPATVLAGSEIVSLMRRHRVTIRALSKRMQITQKRIRKVRESGLQDWNTARDWIEAITGRDPGCLPSSDGNF